MSGSPVKVIFDTDMGGGGCQDVDDVGTLFVLNALVDNGEAELLAIMVNTSPDKVVGAVSVIQHYYGRDDVPIGAYKGTGNGGVSSYVKLLADNWPSPLKSKSEVADATALYRQVLAAQPDNSVVIVSVGMLTNIAALLKSEADDWSPLSGLELVARKVRLVGIMAGEYPRGRECNMQADAPASAYVVDHMPSSVRTFYLGGDVGAYVMSGAVLTDCATEINPARQAYIEYLGGPHRDRPSWDPLTAVVAVRGAAAVNLEWCTECNGYNTVNEHNGWNEWQPSPEPTNEAYLIIAPEQRAAAGAVLDELMCQIPKRPPSSPSPPSSPPPPSIPPAYWQKHTATNCFQGWGAVDMEPGRDDFLSVSSADECGELCNSLAGCDGFVMAYNPMKCYRRGAVDVAKCMNDDNYDTYVFAWAPSPPSHPPSPLLPPGPPPGPPMLPPEMPPQTPPETPPTPPPPSLPAPHPPTLPLPVSPFSSPPPPALPIAIFETARSTTMGLGLLAPFAIACVFCARWLCWGRRQKPPRARVSSIDADEQSHTLEAPDAVAAPNHHKVLSDAPLAQGHRVRVSGIASRPELNGSIAVVLSASQATGRFNVEFASGEALSLRRECLERLTPAVRVGSTNAEEQERVCATQATPRQELPHAKDTSKSAKGLPTATKKAAAKKLPRHLRPTRLAAAASGEEIRMLPDAIEF